MPSEINSYLADKLKLDKIDDSLRDRFIDSMIKYMEHGRKAGVIEGRSIDFLDKHLTELIKLLDVVGLTLEEKIVVLTNLPSLINTSADMVKKYLLLGIIENDNNTFRKDKLINKTNDFRIGLKKLWGRYTLVTNVGYPNINWNILVHASDKEFAKIFVKGAYYKPYQHFGSVEEVLDYVNNVTLEGFKLEEIMCWDVNKELVEKYDKAKN